MIDRGDGMVALSSLSRVVMPKPRLLGPFDPLLLGWTDRTPVVGDQVGLVTSNGMFRPFALVDGRAVATWTLGEGLAPFAPLAPRVAAALAEEEDDVRRFLGSSCYR